MPKVYIEHGDKQYYGYNVILYSFLERLARNAPNYCFDSTTKRRMEDKFAQLSSQYTVKEGSTIHLLNSVPIAIDDIRAHFNIKKKPDAAEYNVFYYNEEKTYKRCYYIPYLILCTEHNTAIFSTYDMALGDIRAYIPDVSVDEIVKLRSYPIYWNYDIKEVFLSVFFDLFKRPAVPVKCLKFSNKNELTLDTIQMLMMAAKGKDKQAVRTQIAILNQTNWQEYPATMYYLRKLLSGYHLIRDIYSAPSRYSKMEINIMTKREYSCKEEKDFKLLQRMFNYILEIKPDTMFLDYSKLVYKGYDKGLYPEDLERVYSMVVRIKNKEKADEQTYCKAN